MSEPRPSATAEPTEPAGPADAVLARVYRAEHTRLLATLVRRFGDLDLAEDAAQEAMEQALRTWPEKGVPQHPLAWLITTARNRALDRVRRDQVYAERLARIHLEESGSAGSGSAPSAVAPPSAPPADDRALAADDIPDERLAMLFGCCHPALAPADRIALMLRFVGGLTTAEVAASLLLPVPTLQARITRAKKRIREARIPLEVPEDPDERDRRLPLVLAAIALVFTEGYAASAGDSPLRAELSAEAIRLARILARSLPGQPEPMGLLGLLLLQDSRASARVGAEGVPIGLEDQERARWNRDDITEGMQLTERAAATAGAGRFTIQAAIAAVHAEPPSFAETDWPQIVALYGLLLRMDPGPVVRMNRAIAVGRRDGPDQGLALLDALAEEPELARHHPFHLARAITLEELGQEAAAARAFRTALELAGNEGERTFIERRLAGLRAE
jgi:RNA polymerase sigma-70 factor (ECF subfamily)